MAHRASFIHIILIELSVGYSVAAMHLSLSLPRNPRKGCASRRVAGLCHLPFLTFLFRDTRYKPVRCFETYTSIRVRQLPLRNTCDRHVRRYFCTRRGLRPRCNRQSGLSGIAVERYGRSYWQFRVY